MSLWKGSSLAILKALQTGARSVSEIVRETGLSQSNVSNHLARLRELDLVTARRSGKRVFYAMTDFALAQFVRGQTARAGPPAELTEAALARKKSLYLQSYLAAVRQGRSDLAAEAVHAGLADGLSWQDLYLHVFGPALQQIGSLWAERQLSVAEEHAATAITMRMMGGLAQPERPPWLERVGTVVVACVEGEEHWLGARMAADFFTAAGWTTHYLGGNLPVEDLVCFVTEHPPDVVALSITLPEHAEALCRTVRRLRALRGDARLPLLVGGGQGFAGEAEASRYGLEIVESDIRRAIERIEAAMRARRGAEDAAAPELVSHSP
jgi:MerR family transcriptional regulator, light-induced transcriptional regulator